MLISFLIPSRGRVDKLKDAIASIRRTCSHPSQVDIRVKLDDDDTLSIERSSEIEAKVYIHPRLGGYASVDYFCTLMARDVAHAKWVCIFNDDAILRCTDPWDELLSAVPLSGFVVHPEIYKLNFSEYPLCEGGAFPIVPNHFWGSGIIPSPSDYHFEVIRKQKNWKTHFLKGVTVFHDRTGVVAA